MCPEDNNPCLHCGACCGFFRVSFYWSEADPDAGGCVPPELTEPLNAYRSVMRGTHSAPVRCVALSGMIGDDARCGIYADRPSPCRELDPWLADGQPDDKCARARLAHGLPPLDPLPAPILPAERPASPLGHLSAPC